MVSWAPDTRQILLCLLAGVRAAARMLPRLLVGVSASPVCWLCHGAAVGETESNGQVASHLQLALCRRELEGFFWPNSCWWIVNKPIFVLTTCVRCPGLPNSPSNSRLSSQIPSPLTENWVSGPQVRCQNQFIDVTVFYRMPQMGVRSPMPFTACSFLEARAACPGSLDPGRTDLTLARAATVDDSYHIC